MFNVVTTVMGYDRSFQPFSTLLFFNHMYVLYMYMYMYSIYIYTYIHNLGVTD